MHLLENNFVQGGGGGGGGVDAPHLPKITLPVHFFFFIFLN